MSTEEEEARKKAEQLPACENGYEIESGTYYQLTELPNAIWVIMQKGRGNINIGNNPKYAEDKKLQFDVEDEVCSAENGVSLVYIRKKA